jgi:hypothetical protein
VLPAPSSDGDGRRAAALDGRSFSATGLMGEGRKVARTLVWAPSTIVADDLGAAIKVVPLPLDVSYGEPYLLKAIRLDHARVTQPANLRLFSSEEEPDDPDDVDPDGERPPTDPGPKPKL